MAKSKKKMPAKAVKKIVKKKIATAKVRHTSKPLVSSKGTRVKKTVSAKKAPAVKAAKAVKHKGLTSRDLEHFKKKLITEKQRVLEEMGQIQSSNLKQSLSDQSGELSHYSYHIGDTASLAYDREFSMGLAERQQKYLEQIDEALLRIEAGTYGICKVTGEAIARERLEEVPVAKYSVKGKEIVDRQKRMMATNSLA